MVTTSHSDLKDWGCAGLAALAGLALLSGAGVMIYKAVTDAGLSGDLLSLLMTILFFILGPVVFGGMLITWAYRSLTGDDYDLSDAEPEADEDGLVSTDRAIGAAALAGSALLAVVTYGTAMVLVGQGMAFEGAGTGEGVMGLILIVLFVGFPALGALVLLKRGFDRILTPNPSEPTEPDGPVGDDDHIHEFEADE